MDLCESTSHSFVIRIWLEETAQEVSSATWRGHITHVPGGERQYIEDLPAVIAFIKPYLNRMGSASRTRGRIRQWLNHWSRCFTRTD
jgi:hypothetical protein